MKEAAAVLGGLVADAALGRSGLEVKVTNAVLRGLDPE